MLVQRRRDKRAALRLMRKLLRKQGFAPKLLVTDKLGSYRAASRHLRLTCPHDQGISLERTTAPKTSIKPCADESARCSGSCRPGLRSASSASMPLFTTRSTFGATSSRDRHCDPPSRSG